MSPTFTDIFCGAGGSSIGLTEAGLELKLAANHWQVAIDTHSANFRDADHLCADVSNYDMRGLPRTDVLWASPICTELSPAGGRRRKPARNAAQQELELFGPVSKDALQRTRATFHDVIRATEVHRYQVVLVENVVEAADWELFDWWIDGMKRLGYQVQFVSVSAAHIGGAHNAPAAQYRDRLYMVFTRIGIPLPNVEPRPLAYCPRCDQDVPAIQSWKKPGTRKIGKYRTQYVYVCPNPSARCRHGVVEPYVLPAAAIIDWSDLGTRIGNRIKPLAAKTRDRIQAGLERFAGPITLEAAGNTFERRPGVRTWPANYAPLTTLTTSATKALATPAGFVPVVVSVNHDDGGRAYPASQAPLSTRTAKIGDGLACPPFITELRNNCTARPAEEPLSTLAASGNHHALTVPPGAFYVRNYGNNTPQNLVHSVADPLGVITAHDHHALVVPYYRTGRATTTAEPLGTLTSHDRFALVDAGITIDDCTFRMLQPLEQLRGQRFPDTYIVTGNKGEQTAQAGNAVAANVAHWLGTAVIEALDTAQ
jgi:DNA (cytosine-5)-methyltransferase 1